MDSKVLLIIIAVLLALIWLTGTNLLHVSTGR